MNAYHNCKKNINMYYMYRSWHIEYDCFCDTSC